MFWKMPYLPLLFAVVTLLMPMVSAAESVGDPKATTRIAFADYPPYHYWEDGEPAGLNIQLINEAFRRLGMDVEYVQMPWRRSLIEVEQGGVAALCAGMRTPERETFAYYPSQHLSHETNWVISLIASDVEVESLDDLESLKIGTVEGYSYGPVFDGIATLDKHGVANESALLKLLFNNRVDVIVACDMVIHHLARKSDVSKLLRYQLRLTSDPLYLILSKAVEGNKELKDRVSGVLLEMVLDGTTDEIMALYQGSHLH